MKREIVSLEETTTDNVNRNSKNRAKGNDEGFLSEILPAEFWRSETDSEMSVKCWISPSDRRGLEERYRTKAYEGVVDHSLSDRRLSVKSDFRVMVWVATTTFDAPVTFNCVGAYLR